MKEKYAHFIAQAGLNPADFRWAFAFGNDGELIDNPEMADELAELVVTGQKLATTSALAGYESSGDALPAVDGKFDLVLNGRGEPVAALTTSKVWLCHFAEVTAEHAFNEGEGDRSLAYWRRVHEEFWRETGEFSPDMMVVCETYERLWPK